MQKMYDSDRILGRTGHGVAPAGKSGLRDCGNCSDLHLFFMQEVKYEGDRTGQTENHIPVTAKNLRNQKRKTEEAIGYIRSAPLRSAFYFFVWHNILYYAERFHINLSEIYL